MTEISGHILSFFFLDIRSHKSSFFRLWVCPFSLTLARLGGWGACGGGWAPFFPSWHPGPSAHSWTIPTQISVER